MDRRAKRPEQFYLVSGQTVTGVQKLATMAWATVGGAVNSRGQDRPETMDRTLVTDEDLLKRCAEGDGSALEELSRRHQGAIYRFLLRMLGSPEDAEEAALDVFVRAWQHSGRFQYRAKVATWLYRIAVNIARDVHSRKKSRPQEPWPENDDLLGMSVGSAETDAIINLERAVSSNKLRMALQGLSDGDRLILVLYYLEDRDYDEIQAITGLSYTVLKTRLARARKRLRTTMGEEN